MTRPVFEEGYSKEDARLGYRASQLERRPDQAAGGTVQEIKVFFDNEEVSVFDWKFHVTQDLDEAVLVSVEAHVPEVSSSGDIEIQIRNETAGVNMLSTVVTIPVGDQDDDAAYVINPANDEVAFRDEIWVRVIAPGTGAQGLGVKLTWLPVATARTIVRGAKGDPGGVTSFQGAWTTSTGYTAGDVVTNGGTAYVATDDHTSGATTEPGVGVDWEDHWLPVADVPLVANLNVCVLSSAGAVPSGQIAVEEVPFDATITGWDLFADRATDAEFDVWVTDYAGYPASSGDSICAAALPTLTGASKNTDSTLTGWTTALSAGDILTFVVGSVTQARRLTLVLHLEK